VHGAAQKGRSYNRGQCLAGRRDYTLRLRVDGGWVGGGWVCGLGYRRCWTVGTDERTAKAGRRAEWAKLTIQCALSCSLKRTVHTD